MGEPELKPFLLGAADEVLALAKPVPFPDVSGVSGLPVLLLFRGVASLDSTAGKVELFLLGVLLLPLQFSEVERVSEGKRFRLAPPEGLIFGMVPSVEVAGVSALERR